MTFDLKTLLSSYLIKIITKPSDIHCHSYISKTAKVRPQQQRTRQQQCTLRSIATCGGPLLSRPWVLNDGQAEGWSAPTWIYLEKHGGFPLFYLPFVGVGVMVAIQFDQVDVHPKQKVIDLELDDVRVRRTYLLPYLLPLCSLPFQQLVSIHLLHKPGKKPLDIHEKRQNKGGGEAQPSKKEPWKINTVSSQFIRQVASNVLRSPRQNLTIQWQVNTMEPLFHPKNPREFFSPKFCPGTQKRHGGNGHTACDMSQQNCAESRLT